MASAADLPAATATPSEIFRNLPDGTVVNVNYRHGSRGGTERVVRVEKLKRTQAGFLARAVVEMDAAQAGHTFSTYQVEGVTAC